MQRELPGLSTAKPGRAWILAVRGPGNPEPRRKHQRGRAGQAGREDGRTLAQRSAVNVSTRGGRAGVSQLEWLLVLRERSLWVWLPNWRAHSPGQPPRFPRPQSGLPAVDRRW